MRTHEAPPPQPLARPSDGLTLFRHIAFKRFTRRGRPVVEPRCPDCGRQVEVVGSTRKFLHVECPWCQ